VYGIAWIIVVGVVVVGGLVLVLGLVTAAPLVGVLALIMLTVGAFGFYTARRGRIGTERERAARGQTGDGAPVSGEGGRPSSSHGKDYEPAL